MTARNFRRFTMAALAAPLVLGLAACGQDAAKDGAAATGEAIAKIAAPAGKSWGDVVSVTPEGGYRMGNPDAPIKLVEYGSLTCNHCAEFTEASSAEIRDTFVASGRVSFEFRNFVRDPIDLTAAQLTRCGAPEGFFALTDQAMANQKEMFEKAQGAGEAAYTAAMNQPEAKRGLAIAELAGLLDFFASRGISRDQAAACLADTAKATALATTTSKDAERYQINGTPTFMLNGQKLDGNTWAPIKVALENAGAR